MTTTERLRIFAPSPVDLRAFRDGGRDALATRLGVAVPAGWPVFSETVEGPGRVAETDPWGTYWGIYARDAALAVEGGVSTPDAEGLAVFGYAVVADYRGRGLATEFAAALIGVARRSGQVRAIDAYTFPAGAVSPEGFAADPSIGVLKRLGFARVGQDEHWHWRKHLSSDAPVQAS